MKFSPLFLIVFLLIFPSAVWSEANSTDARNGNHSIYQLGSKWETQDGKTIPFASLKGRPALLTMGFASCEYACPRLVANLQAIEEKLTPQERKNLRVVFVSIDPERDTPKKLKAFLKKHNVDETRWFGLHGGDDDILELSVALGFRFRKLDNGSFAHSNLILLISPDGGIVARKKGFDGDVDELVAELRKVLRTEGGREK